MLALFYFQAASPTPKSVAVGLFAVVPIPCGYWELPLLSLAENLFFGKYNSIFQDSKRLSLVIYRPSGLCPGKNESINSMLKRKIQYLF